MKKQSRFLAAMLAALALSMPAHAAISFEGKVVSSESVAVLAPFGGLVDSVGLRVGDPIKLGDSVANISTTKVYATSDGTISGVFAREGDATDGVVERYGAVVYIEPTNRYKIAATTEKAYNSSDTKYIHIGEKVYVSCSKDGTHTGTAVVTGLSDVDESGNTPYKLEVTGGDFYMAETVGIYRSKDYSAESRIGRGTIQQTSAIAVKGSGSVLKMHVSDGDKVERGELLFETVDGALDGLYAMDNEIVSNVSGIVASVDAKPGDSVSKGSKLITVYPDGTFQIEVKVSEMDLNSIHEGDKVSIEFEFDADGELRLDGTVVSISRVNVTEEGASAASSAEYSAYISFEENDQVRLGMSVVVYTQDDLADVPATKGE